MSRGENVCKSAKEEESISSRRLAGKAFHAGIMVYLLFGFCLGCASMSGKPNEENLMAAATKFNDAVRWQSYKIAAIFVDQSQQDAFWNTVDKLSDKIRVTEYDIRNVSSEEPASAVLLIRYSCFRLNDPRIKPVTLHQRWRYDEKTKMWMVTQPDIEAMLP